MELMDPNGPFDYSQKFPHLYFCEIFELRPFENTEKSNKWLSSLWYSLFNAWMRVTKFSELILRSCQFHEKLPSIYKRFINEGGAQERWTIPQWIFSRNDMQPGMMKVALRAVFFFFQKPQGHKEPIGVSQ